MSNKAEIVITALDKASATINRISEKFDAMNRPLANVQKSFARLGDSAGINKAGAAARAFGSDIARVGVVGIAAAAGLGMGFARLEGRLGDFADAMANAGVKGQALVNMRAAADAMVPFGVKAEDASAAMLKLAQNQSLAGAGNEKLQEAFAAAGISMQQLRSMKPDELFAALNENFSKSEKSGAKLAVATALMGKSSTKMVEAMSQGPEALAKFKEKYRAALLTEKDYKDFGAAGDKLDGLGFLFGRISEKLGAIAAPKLTPILDKLETKLLAALPGLFENFSKLLDKINEENVSQFFADVGAAFSNVAKVFQTLHGFLGTTGMVVAAVALAFAPTIAAVTAFAFTVGGPLIAVLIKLGGFVLPMIGKALMVLSRAFLLNPIGLAITLVAAAAYLLYRNWDDVVGGLKALWENLAAVFSATWALMKGAAKLAIAGITGWFEGMYDGFISVWDRISQWFGTKLQSITALLPDWMTGGGINVTANGPKGGAQTAAPISNGPEGGAQTAAQIISGPAGGKTDVGGRIQIELIGAPAKVTQLSSNNNAVPIDVSSGLYGVG